MSRLRFKPEPGSKTSPDLWSRVRSGFAIPAQDHSAIDAEVDWFVRNQGFLDRTSQRARPYLHHIVEQVEARGVPSEIALLPVIESGFQPFAYSPARASGIWQFIPETGRRFGLRQNWWYDGRRDVLASTRAALDYLTTLRDQFGGDWLLAVAAYNCGEGAVGRAIQENQRRGLPTDFWNLSLPEETRNYVPRLLAFSRVVASPTAYGIRLAAIPNQPYLARVDLDGPVDLNVAASVAGIPLADLRHLNPGFSRWATDPDGPHHLVLPVHKADDFSARLRELPDHERLPWRRHVVRRGETLASLASRYGTDASTLREVNQVAGNRVRPGSVVRVPLGSRASGTTVMLADASEAVAQPPARAVSEDQPRERKAEERKADPVLKVKEPAVTTQKLVVRQGETLYSLARRYGVTPQALASLNGLSPKAGVKTGQTLRVQAQAEPAVIASQASAPAKTPKLAAAAATSAAPEKQAASTVALAKPAATANPRSKAGASGTQKIKKAKSATADPIRYRVKPGESLWGISQRFGVSVAMLRRWNHLSDKQAVQAGQEINVYREETRVARAG